MLLIVVVDTLVDTSRQDMNVMGHSIAGAVTANAR
ncbi:hypothetical protein B1M_15450 [Burkholderia sp. TJI49]|nr:hypothetical protein B1M_15450 [Burkholderia sp. TJI49]